jgi:hypothetical protein
MILWSENALSENVPLQSVIRLGGRTIKKKCGTAQPLAGLVQEGKHWAKDFGELSRAVHLGLAAATACDKAGPSNSRK